ncbi:MAG TPA: hypothetical protein V6D47_18200 [Oscillatoriaceae cyanobacterium]
MKSLKRLTAPAVLLPVLLMLGCGSNGIPSLATGVATNSGSAEAVGQEAAALPADPTSQGAPDLPVESAGQDPATLPAATSGQGGSSAPASGGSGGGSSGGGSSGGASGGGAATVGGSLSGTGGSASAASPTSVAASSTATPKPGATTSPTASSSTPAPASSSAPVTVSGLHTLFGNQSVPRASDGTLTRGYQLIGDLGMTAIREGFNWKNIETGKGQYVSWMNYFDDKVSTLHQMGVGIEAMICDTPSWASSSGSQYAVPNGLSAPIFADGTDVYKPGVGANPANTYASYLYDLVSRYKGEITTWQVWNEPDFPSGDLTAGTTSNGSTRYWQGSVQDYVRLLKVSAAIVHGLDPHAQVALGGLGYDSYLSAILDNGGANYFDVVDFHAYGTDKTSSNGVLNSAWGFLGRYQALKKVLDAHGVSKPFACSETGITANLGGEQASYVAKVFATAQGLGDVEMVHWAVFTNPGFNNIGLIDQATMSQQTAGYPAYKFATSELSGALPVGALSGSGVQGYRFQKADGTPLAVAWSSGSSASVSIPIGAGKVYDKDGNAIAGSFSNGQITLNLTSDPVYVVGN